MAARAIQSVLRAFWSGATIQARLRGRLCAAATVTALVAGLTVATVLAPAAHADPGPVAQRTAAGVTADALPTAQLNGVGWTQVVSGNTVFVGGSFSSARPAGSPAGSNETPRNNLMAYTLSTGVMTSWAPSANAQVLAMALSPDGTRLYVAGQFTSINGANTQRIAAFSTATGNLITSFAASTDSTIKAIAVTNTTVYVGGGFSTADGVARSRLAAFSAADGSLLPWNPGADITVYSMTMNPDQSLVIVGGAFDQIAGTAAQGLAALNPTSGSRVYWAATDTVSDYGQDNDGPGTGAAIYSLSHDATNVYGTGYNYYGYGDLEGTFSANGDTGAVNWVESCHGDTYGAFANSAAVYTVSHAHYCGDIGGFPQSNPWSINMRHAIAFTLNATGTTLHDPLGYHDWYGTPAPSLIDWFPDFTTGTYTGQGQAAWAITGNDSYVVAAGEFPSVNGTAQQGMVRFAVPSIAPNKQGPRLNTTNWNVNVRPISSTSARISFSANWDRDDENLNYSVVRNGKVVYTTTATSQFWNLPTIAFTDTGLTAGASYSYYVKVTDPSGNPQWSATTNVTMPTNLTLSQYAQDVFNDGAIDYWRLDETSGTVQDWAGSLPMTVNGGVTTGTAGAIIGDSDAAYTFNGSNGFTATQTPIQGPNLFSEELWFKTTTTKGGKILGFGDKNSGLSQNYDRHVYMNTNGTVSFGVYNNGAYTVTSQSAYNDGTWHYVVATLSSAGLALYIDGKRIGTNGGTTVGQNYSGYWRIGGDSPWSGNAYFAGSVDEVAIYPTALTLTQVRQHYTDSGRSLGGTPAPTDAYGKTIYQDQPDFYYRLDDANGPTALDSSGNGNNGIYSGGETFGVTSPVAGSGHTAVTFNGVDGTLGSSGPIAGPSVYSEEAWFNTTTTQGGKILGFGNAQSGLSQNYDRHVYMLPSGQLVFGTWTGTQNTATTQASYNDGNWHYVAATQGPDGMRLYVDGQLAATNPQAGQQSYSGYWRVGGDRSWAGSNYFAGTIDEAAFYSTELTQAQVQAHYSAASVNHPPTAAFTYTTSNLQLTADGTSSTDSDGTITAYSWKFGDGVTATGATPTHTYAAAGTYTVTLTVTDNNGLSGTTSQSVTVTAAPPNQSPVAAFTDTVSHLSVAFDSSGSYDPDGTIASYAWDFGDGGASTAANPTHVYASAGTYSVTLTVTDNDGASTSTTNQVTATAAPTAPTAAFSYTANGLVVSFSSAGSSDPNPGGTITGYAWNFGDGGTSSSQNPTYTYAAGGTYTVTLTVTDNNGLTGSATHTVTVTAPPQPPKAAFTTSANGLSVSFDSSGTTDPNPGATITGYSWTFGDGGTSTVQNPTYTYGAAGTYKVTLTVTDSTGTSGSASQTLTVSTQVAADAFERSVSNGWGTADVGGAWTKTASSLTLYSVDGHTGTMTLSAPGTTDAQFLNSVSQQNLSGTIDVSLSAAPTGGGTYVWLDLRHSSSGEYRARLRLLSTSVTLQFTRLVSGTETILGQAVVPGLTYNVGDVLRLAFAVTGNAAATLTGTVWKVGSSQPASPQLTSTDSTAALQVPGSLGITSYLSGQSGTTAPITVHVDNLNVTAS